MNTTKCNAQFRTAIKSTLLISLFTFSFFSNKMFGQEKNVITDFYEYVNKEWSDNIILPENIAVINNWGILWGKITTKSIEILSGNDEYELDKNNQYMLIQLRNFYKSAEKEISDKKKRVYFIQEQYPLMFGVVFSKITISDNKEEKIKELIKYLTSAYKQKIENSKHIEEKNIDFFLTILDDIKFQIGAPDISYLPEMPELSADSYETNISLTETYLAKINPEKPRWVSPPFETDCRYDFKMNAVKIYAGTLFDSDFSNEYISPELFATIGRTIAHEMTHAFDRFGKKFNKKDWKHINTALVNQFNQYTVQDMYSVNGEKTLQENFADLGGIEVSFLALQLYMKDKYPKYSEEKKLEAIRNYFIAYADFWKEKATSEYEISSVNRIHTPQKFRTIGPVYNQNEFYNAFKIDPESEYYLPDTLRICIW